MARKFTRNIWDVRTFNREFGEEFEMVAGSRSLNMYVYRQLNTNGKEVLELTQGQYWKNQDGSSVFKYPLNKRGDIIEKYWYPVYGELEDCKRKLVKEAVRRYSQGSSADMLQFVNKIKELQ